MRRILVVVLLLLTFPATSYASFPERYEGLAMQYWKVAPKCEQIQYTWTDDLAVWFADETYSVAVGAARLNGCQMWLKTPYWFGQSKATRCALFIHEWGHLIGMEHTDRQNSVMQPELWVPRLCSRKGWL